MEGGSLDLDGDWLYAMPLNPRWNVEAIRSRLLTPRWKIESFDATQRRRLDANATDRSENGRVYR
jgi:hypothetical protein